MNDGEEIICLYNKWFRKAELTYKTETTNKINDYERQENRRNAGADRSLAK